MRIGLLTLPFNNNYGGYLQAFALIRILRIMGQDVILINRRPEISYSPFSYLKGFIRNKICGDKYRMYNRKSMDYFYRQKGEYMIPFVDKYISPKTKPIYITEEYSCLKEYSLDAIIVGSDQVWRPCYVPHIEEYFLKVIPQRIRKIAYSASFGSDKLEYNSMQLKECQNLLSNFTAVSVREKSGLELLKKYFKFENAEVTLDPTMLLPKEEYIKLLKTDTDFDDLENFDIFAYILDRTDAKTNLINRIAINGKVFDIMNISKTQAYFSIEKWLSSIYKSKIIITDSFHGTAFSILFNKPFYVISNYKRGNSRLTDLLSLVGLENRLINIDFDIKTIDLNINWKAVNIQLEKQRDLSLKFLKGTLL